MNMKAMLSSHRLVKSYEIMMNLDVPKDARTLRNLCPL